jgi:hypothetical protein
MGVASPSERILPRCDQPRKRANAEDGNGRVCNPEAKSEHRYHPGRRGRSEWTVPCKSPESISNFSSQRQEEEIPPGIAGAPQFGDLIADLVRSCYVVVPDGPQMRGCSHGRFSIWSSTAASVD